MANPQKENGHIEIAIEIWNQLAKTRIPGQARQILDFILRKTYGWHKKEDKISLSQFVQGTELTKTTVCKGINKLLEMNLITKKGNAKSLFTQKGNDVAITYGFQKDYDKWNPLPKKVTLPKKVKHVTQKGNQTLPKKGTTKDTITKDTITKDIGEKIWNEFKRHRTKLKKPMTPYAEELIIKKLLKYKSEGLKVEDVINQTIEKGYQDVKWVADKMIQNKKAEKALKENEGRPF